MTNLLTITLRNLQFYAHHGLFQEERKTGNIFEVDLNVFYSPSGDIVTDISETINYATLYELVKENMQHPRELLETLAMEIVENIHLSFPQLKKVEISIQKLQPPIANFAGKVGVSFTKEFA